MLSRIIFQLAIALAQVACWAVLAAASSAASAASSSSSSKLFIAANWKCTLESIQDVDKQCADLNKMWSSLDEATRDAIELCVNPPFVYIDRVRSKLHRDIRLGSQNALDARGPDRKNTGATTVAMLRSVGASWILLGHSDRRNNLGESDALIATKVRAALDGGLGVTLTIGELKWQRRVWGLPLRTLRRQLGIALSAVPKESDSGENSSCWENIVVAYEPVWAVGEGSTPCSPREAQRINAALRKFIHDTVGPEAARKCRFTYTGSVNDANAGEYASLPDVDGFVVGRAGLDPIKLKSIIKTLASSRR